MAPTRGDLKVPRGTARNQRRKPLQAAYAARQAARAARPAGGLLALSVSSTPYKVDRTLITLKGWRVTSAWTRHR